VLLENQLTPPTLLEIAMLRQLAAFRRFHFGRITLNEGPTSQIVRFVQEHQPPIVEAQFCDSAGRLHTFIDKSAIFTTDRGLEASSKYPQPGVIRCDELARYQSQDGREMIRVRTEVESTEGLSEFIVAASQFSA
jgi:hypothetical protein